MLLQVRPYLTGLLIFKLCYLVARFIPNPKADPGPADSIVFAVVGEVPMLAPGAMTLGVDTGLVTYVVRFAESPPSSLAVVRAPSEVRVRAVDLIPGVGRND